MWWKIPNSRSPQEQGSPKTPGEEGAAASVRGGKEGTSRRKAPTVGGGSAGGGGRRSVVVGGGASGGGGAGDAIVKNATPEIVGFVVYRYRLDGREWHKKGATSVDGAQAVCASIKALSNGLVYR